MKWKLCIALFLQLVIIHGCTAQGGNETNANSTCNNKAEDDSKFLNLPFDDLVALIAFAVILVLCVIITALITFIVMCVCIRRKYKRSSYAYDPNAQSSLSSKPSYQPVNVGQSDGTITKSDVGIHPNPAYGANEKMNMNTNPAYKTCN